eukprot:5539876-Pleurochrysis_carterae.AAC.1
MFRSFAKLHLLTAAGCLTLAFIHTYWILGHRVLNFRECPNPTLVMHVSCVDFCPLYSATATAASHIASHASRVALRGGFLALELDCSRLGEI